MLRAFTKALLFITSAELGDKSFLITILLSMRHPRGWVFLGTVLSLTVMTVLSVVAGKLFSSVNPAYLRYGSIVVFLGFGFKLLYQGWKMSPQHQTKELALARFEVDKSEQHLGDRPTVWKIMVETFTLVFLAEWGDRTQFATFALAATNDRIGVTMGAIMGHTICAAIAIFAGRSIAGKVSRRLVTLIGGGLFILYAVISMFEVPS